MIGPCDLGKAQQSMTRIHTCGGEGDPSNQRLALTSPRKGVTAGRDRQIAAAAWTVTCNASATFCQGKVRSGFRE